jgi:hypothetical protein
MCTPLTQNAGRRRYIFRKKKYSFLLVRFTSSSILRERCARLPGALPTSSTETLGIQAFLGSCPWKGYSYVLKFCTLYVMLILLCRQKMIMHSQPSVLPKGVFDLDLMFLTPYSDCATLHREHRKLSYWCPSLSLKAICHPELSTSLRWIPLNVCVSLWSSHDDVRWSILASNGASGYRTSWKSFRQYLSERKYHYITHAGFTVIYLKGCWLNTVCGGGAAVPLLRNKKSSTSSPITDHLHVVVGVSTTSAGS